MDPRGSSDVVDHPQARGREDTEVLGVARQSEDLAAPHQQRATRRPGLLYVPIKHEPDDEPGRLPSSRRWAYLIFFRRLTGYYYIYYTRPSTPLTGIHREKRSMELLCKKAKQNSLSIKKQSGKDNLKFKAKKRSRFLINRSINRNSSCLSPSAAQHFGLVVHREHGGGSWKSEYHAHVQGGRVSNTETDVEEGRRAEHKHQST